MRRKNEWNVTNTMRLVTTLSNLFYFFVMMYSLHNSADAREEDQFHLFLLLLNVVYLGHDGKLANNMLKLNSGVGIGNIALNSMWNGMSQRQVGLLGLYAATAREIIIADRAKEEEDDEDDLEQALANRAPR